MYPNFPPIWCSESEVPQLTDIVEKINTVTSNQHLLLKMTKALAVELFNLRNDAVPKDIIDSTLTPMNEEVYVYTAEDSYFLIKL